jgi:hypothetical protein
MKQSEKEARIAAVQQFVAKAAGGISIGAALMIVAPLDVMSFVGLEHPDQMIAVKTALLAAAVSIAARCTRVTIRRR